MMHYIFRYLAIYAIRLYRFLLSPLLLTQCRFYPSCSHYAEDAITKYGVWKGCFITLKRLLKCHPFHPGGYDPIR